MKFGLYFFVAALLLFTTVDGFAQRRNDKKYIGIGLEIDVLPFISGGYSGALWLGYGQLRGRATYSQSTIPQTFVATGFENNNVTAYGFVADYFLRSSNFDQMWIGLGVEYWDGSITSETSRQSADYTNYVITLGFGYVWKFYRNFYLNPSLGFQVIAAGDEVIYVGDTQEEFSNPSVLPELSIKIGWHYGVKQNSKWYMKSGKQPKKKRVRVIY